MYLHTRILFLGFISGFLLLITGNTLNFWLAKYGASYETVGLFSLVSIPYAFNFLWAPLFDKFKITILPFKILSLNLHYRTYWLIFLHILGAISVFFLSFLNPVSSAPLVAVLAVIISFINSSQDIVLNAYRSELTPKDKIGQTAGTYIFGYRLGMIVSGPVTIGISEYMSFQQIYFILSIVYLSFPIAIVLLELYSDTEVINQDKLGNQEKIVFEYNAGLISAFKNIGSVKTILGLLSFLALYRLADNFIGVMINLFLLYEGFNESQIAFAGKLCGIIGSAFGGLVASMVINNTNLIKCLIWFGILHSFSHLGYIAVIYARGETIVLVIATIFDSVTGGITMAAYIALITSLCHGEYRATQYAIFSAMMGVSRTVLPSMAGYVVWTTNWQVFFIISALLIIPSLIILNSIENTIIRRIND